MAKISGANTKPEKLVQAFLRSQGFRFRLHVGSLPGKPDIVIPTSHAAIFVNGCFWHHHPGCKRSKLPSTRKRFWRNKIIGNAARDRRNKAALQKLGWRPLTVWQCQLSPSKATRRLAALSQALCAIPKKYRQVISRIHTVKIGTYTPRHQAKPMLDCPHRAK
jgi:DNA mismatch endonuclease Vsr